MTAVASTPTSSPPVVSFLKRMMECTYAGEEVEVSYDGFSERIFHVSAAGLEPPPHHKVAKTHDHLHVDDMTDDEISQSWYTKEDIRKFRKEKAKDKKAERRLRKQRIQQERQQRENTSDGDSSSVSTAETEPDSSKRVTWGMVERLQVSSMANHEETIVFTNPAIRMDNQDQTTNRSSTSTGVQFRVLKASQRDPFEQGRIEAIQETFYQSGLLFRGESNRAERYSPSRQCGDDFFEEEKKQDDTQTLAPSNSSTMTMLFPEECEDKNEETRQTNELDEIFDLLDVYSTDTEEEEEKDDDEEEETLDKEEEDEDPIPNDEIAAPPQSNTIVSQQLGTMEEKSPPTNEVVAAPLPSTSPQIATGPVSFYFPKYPAAYNQPAEENDYFEVRLEEVYEERQRSPELVDLARDYQDFRRKLHNLVKSVKKYHAAMKQMEQARSMCLQECSTLIQEPSTESLQPGSFQYAVEKSPIIKLKELAETQQTTRATEFQENVLDYALDWEKCVTQKVDRELKEVKKLQQSRLHYEKKVEVLRKKVNGLDIKGKEIPSDLLERLGRNEAKLKDAWETHELRASRLCLLIEQVTHAGWKDLYPLVANLMKYEFNRSGGELAMYGKFPLMLDAFQKSFQAEQAKSD